MKSLNTTIDGKYCSDIVCEGNWVCQYWKSGGNAMVRCIANWSDGKWTKVIDWHDDNIKELNIIKDDFRTIHGPPSISGLDIIGFVCFVSSPVEDFDCKEKCF